MKKSESACNRAMMTPEKRKKRSNQNNDEDEEIQKHMQQNNSKYAAIQKLKWNKKETKHNREERR